MSKHCHSCRILDKYDRLNAAGYCSYCVARGHDKRPLPAYETPVRHYLPCTGFKNKPTMTQAKAFQALVKYGSPSSAARALGKSLASVSAALSYLEQRIGYEVYYRPEPAERYSKDYQLRLTAAGKRLYEELQSI